MTVSFELLIIVVVSRLGAETFFGRCSIFVVFKEAAILTS